MVQVVNLGNAWPNKGFVGLYQEYGGVVRHALRMEVLPSSGPKPDVQEVYRERIKDWKHFGAIAQEYCIANLDALELCPVRRQFTICEMKFEPCTKMLTDVMSTEVAWRWKYYEFAFAIYWALSFHLTNSELRNKAATWKEFVAFANNVHPEVANSKTAKRAFMLALYERTLGLETDIARQIDPYIRLIASGDTARIGAFRSYVTDMKRRIETELKH